MELVEIARSKRREILVIAAKYGVTNIRVFGSAARGEADRESDLDLLVDLEPGRSLIDMGAFMMELRALLDLEIDVVTDRGLQNRIRDRALSEAISL